MPTGEKIRVMIVDDVSETRENVRKLLQFESDVDVVGVARTGKEAIQISQDLNPDVILMDINMPDMDGISATEAIRAKQPRLRHNSIGAGRSELHAAGDVSWRPGVYTKPPWERMNFCHPRAGGWQHRTF